MRVGNRWSVQHIYEDRATGRVYVIAGGQVREMPDHIGRMLIGAHPDKLYDANDVGAAEPRAVDPSTDNRMVDTESPGVRKRKRGRRTKTR